MSGEVALYHCWTRCVRRAFLCGKDPLTGNDYEYRRVWIRAVEQKLAALFGVEIGFHAIMANHLHLVLRTRPDVVKTWSDEEVVERWLKVTHLIKSRDGTVREVSQVRKRMELARPGRVQELRERLSNPSYFMAALCEHVARRSNREEGSHGSFWEDRYKCRELADEASLLVCGIYIDLNQIRAGEATTPETSRHTSAYDRIVARRQRKRASRKAARHKAGRASAADGWLCELTIDERRPVTDPSMVRSASARRASDKGLLPIRLEEYLALLDATGRLVREGQEAIPSHLAPILDRLGIRQQRWGELIRHFHDRAGLVVGKAERLIQRAEQAGRRWYRGQSFCAAAFG